MFIRFMIMAVLAVAPVFVMAAPPPAAPSNEFASNVVQRLQKIQSLTTTAEKHDPLRYAVVYMYANRSKLAPADTALIEAELLKAVTQKELDDLMNYDAACRAYYPAGVVCPKSLGLDKFFAMYDAAFRKSGRKTAYSMFKQTEGEFVVDRHMNVSTGDAITRNITTVHDAISFMNEELYYPVDLFAKLIARELILEKRRQLIDRGYSVVYTHDSKGKRVYSEGAELLLEYCRKLVDAFNAPYFLGLNARLEEVGHKERFNNKRLISVVQARDLAKKVLYGESVLTANSWMLRMTCGVSDYNALVDRINNGDPEIRKLSENNPVKK